MSSNYQTVAGVWHIIRNGVQAGPFSDQQIVDWAQMGELAAGDLLWRQGWADWQPAGAVFRLPASRPSAPPPAPDMMPPPAPHAAGYAAVASRTADPAAPKASAGERTHWPVAAIAGIGFLGGLLDFLKPITDDMLGLSSTTAFMVIGLLGLVAASVGLRMTRFDHWRTEMVSARLICAAMAIVGGIPFAGGLIDPTIRDRGAVAKFIPPVSSVQDEIMRRIGADTARLVESSQRIEKELRNVKKETSADPRKELMNMGISWNNDNLWKALASHDARATMLFIDGGMRFDPTTTVMFVEQWFDEAIAKAIVAKREIVDQAICTSETLPMPFRLLNIWLQNQFILNKLDTEAKRSFFFSICRPKELRAVYQRRLGDPAAKERARQCTDRLVAKHGQAPASAKPGAQRQRSESIDFGPMEGVWRDAFTNISPPKQSEQQIAEGWRKAHSQLSMVALQNSGRMTQSMLLQTVASRACNQAHDNQHNPSESDAKQIRAVLAVIPGG